MHARVIRNPGRRNAAYSRNRGAKKAKSNYLAFLDSDDAWFPLHLRQALVSLEGHGANSLYVSRFGASQQIRDAPARAYTDGYRFLFERIGDPRSSVLVVGKAFFEEVGGFDESLEKHQDWDFALRCAEVGALVLGGSTTAFLDPGAEDRMSSRIDIAASHRFLSRHASNMTERQLARFFSRLLISAAEQSMAEHQKAVGLFREHLCLWALPKRYWPLVYYPKSGLALMNLWLWIKGALVR
jgi:glycosyltransferase involved in cell wall biosynthesis